MDKLKSLLKEKGIDANITLQDIPDIDLYMDQVIQLFENKFSKSKRDESEKVLTKTMINNYAKGKLFFPIKNKKYSKEHLMLISLIYQLKGVLSINDIKVVLEGINEKIVKEDFKIDQFYSSYLQLTEKNSAKFQVDLQQKVQDAKLEIEKLGDKNHEYLEKVLLITSLAYMSNLYRKVSEILVDDLNQNNKKIKDSSPN